MLASIGLGFSSALFNGIGITLIVPLMLSFLGVSITQSANMPGILKSIFSAFDGIPENYRAIAMIGSVILAIVLKNLANYANAVTSGSLIRRFTSNMRRDGFKLLLDVDIHYFSEMRLGDLMNSINGEVSRVATAVRSLINAIIAVITILVFLTILLLISWQLTLVATVLLGAIAFLNQFLLRYAKTAGQELSRFSSALSSKSIEILSGIRLVKSVANEESEYQTIDYLIEQRENASYRSQLIFASVSPVNEVASTFALIVLIVVGRMIFVGQIEAFSSIIITYLFVLTRMLPAVGQLNGARNQLANSSASVEILDDFLNRNNKPIMNSGSRVFEGLNREIRFKDLWFRYPNSDDWTLQDVNITLPKGHTLALVGSSGAGKSTLADLLARFYDPNKGEIEIDGIDLKDFDLNRYRAKIGIVSQETFLFNTSIRDNIRYGCPEATDEEVYQAAKQANAFEFIQKLSEGFDTQIGDRGVMLSGGQRQRLAIARALLQNPDILILDEATSALDTVSERLVQQALENLSKQRTTLVIAHRLSTVQKAHQIVVLDRGRVMEVGNHQELLEKNGHYAKLHSMQFADHPKEALEPTATSKQLARNLSQTSYSIRTQLNGMIGLLSLIEGNMIESQEEYEEFADRAYQSALNILQSLEKLESQLLSAK